MRQLQRCALALAFTLIAAPAARAQDEGEEEGDAAHSSSPLDALIEDEQASGVSTESVEDPGARQKIAGGEAQSVAPVASVTAQLPDKDPNDGAFTGEAPRFEVFGCPGKDVDLDRTYVICADVAHGRLQHAAIFPSAGAVVLPNRSFVVKVLHPADQRIAVTFTGTKGIYSPTLRTDEKGGARGQKRDETVKWVVSQWTLPPVLPPTAMIVVELRDGRTNALLDSVTFDLVVDNTYMGAVRLGVAAVGLGATHAEYTVVKTPGSSQGEIVGLPQANANFELVVGYAAYLERGGRPTMGCRGGLSCFAPYLGIGVIGQNNHELDFFESLHLGVEWEPVPSFSVALTGVARRVDRLRPGLQVGGPANEGDTLTTQRISFGAGVVFNVSPQFLKVARHGGSLF